LLKEQRSVDTIIEAQLRASLRMEPYQTQTDNQEGHTLLQQFHTTPSTSQWMMAQFHATTGYFGPLTDLPKWLHWIDTHTDHVG
jgi:hypothetical protein